MAKRNILKIDLTAFDDLLKEIEDKGNDIKPLITDALTQAGETIAEDTVEAMASVNLPAKGKYSHGDTMDSIVRNPKVKWTGDVAEISVGFDFAKGAGGLLISGTPRMKPDYKLEDIYARKKYIKHLMIGIRDVLEDGLI